MAAVENEGISQLPNNKELQETCYHINIKHRVRSPLFIMDLGKFYLDLISHFSVFIFVFCFFFLLLD